jgi:hypothetical protein
MSLENSEEKNILLQKCDGRVGQIGPVKKRRFLEGGTFGSVYESDVTVTSENRNRNFSLVIKFFKEAGGAERAFEAYEKLKSIGLKVPPTYRLDRENNRIFMTDYGWGGNVALSSTSSNSHAEGLVIGNILNLETLKKEIETQCALAAKNRIQLPEDAFFFIVPRKGGDVDMNFVIADLDLIFSEYAKELNLDEDGCFKENNENAEKALNDILKSFQNGTDEPIGTVEQDGNKIIEEEMSEHIPTSEEVFFLFEKLVKETGENKYEDVRKLEDERGLYLWEIKITQKDGSVEYSYIRKGNYKERGLAGGSSSETAIHVTYFDNDGIPISGHSVSKLIDDKWIDTI